ncbi:Ca2+-dependent phosphoinositide-specific phospholipase C [Planctomycetota bacterium]
MNSCRMFDRFLFNVVFALIGFVAMSERTDAGDVDARCEAWRFNELQYIGTHNSYHIAPSESMAILMKVVDFNPDAEWTAERLNVALDYTHPSLTTQLRLGMRQFELDIYADPNGGRFSHPGALRLLQTMPWAIPIPFNPDGDLDKPGFKVLHKPEYDFMSMGYLLTETLQEIHAWSEANPGHWPLIIHVEVKDKPGEALTEDYEPATVEAFDRATWLRLEEDIKSVFSMDKIVTPERGCGASMLRCARRSLLMGGQG